MANNSNHIMSRYGKWITNKQKERLRKLYKGYRQSTAGDMRSQYLNARKGMYGVRTTASAYGLGEGYVARKKAQMDSSLAEAGRQYAAQADAAFENNAVRPAANATIQAENERKQREYEEKLRKAREKAARQAQALDDYKQALEDYNRNKDKTDKENAKRLAEYKKAMAKYKKELKNAKQRGEKLDRLPQRQILHGGQPLPKGLSLSADLHQYEGATSTPKPLKPLPKGKGKGKGKGRGGLLSTDMYEYESGTGHQPTATSHQGLNNRPVAPKTNYAANQTAVQNRKKAKEAVVGKPTMPILAITDTPVPVPPHIEKDLVAKVEAMKPEEVPQLKTDYINSAVEHEKLVGDLYNALKPDMNRVSLAQEYNHWVGVAQNTTLSPAERKQAAMYASRAAEEYNLQDNGKAHKERVATLMQMVNDSHEQLTQMQYILQQKGVRMSEDEVSFDANWLRSGNQLYGADNALVQQAQTFTTGNKADTADLRQHLYAIDKHNRHRGWGLDSWEIPPEEAQWLEANGYGWINTTPELRSIEMSGDNAIPFSGNVEAYYQQINAKSHSYQRERNATTKLMAFSRMKESEQKNAIAAGEQKTGLAEILAGTSLEKAGMASLASLQGGRRAGSFADLASQIAKNLGLPKDYVTVATVEQLLQDEGSLAFIDYCYGIGDEQTAKDYLYGYTEVANQAQGEKIADLVSFNDAGKNASKFEKGALEVIRTVVEFMAQFGYGATGNFAKGVERIFTNEDVPVSVGEAFSGGVTQNKLERRWNPFWAQAVDSAAVSAGNNAASMLLGKGIGMVGSAVGGAVGGTIGTGIAKATSYGGSTLMGASAMGHAKQEALREGYGNKAATMYGILDGISETILQENIGGLVGLGDHGALTKALGGLVKKIPSTMGRWGVNMVLDGLSEVGQELFGNVFENINRTVTLGEKHGLFDNFKDEAGQTIVSTLLSTWLLNSVGLGGAVKQSAFVNRVSQTAGISKSDALMMYDVEQALMTGEDVDPKNLSKYNELSAVLMSSIPSEARNDIEAKKYTLSDWFASKAGKTNADLTTMINKASADQNGEVAALETESVDRTDEYNKAIEGDPEAVKNMLLTAKPTGKKGNVYYTTVDGKDIDVSKLSIRQRITYMLAQKVGKAFKKSFNVVVHDTLPGDNAVMVGQDGSLHIALDAQNARGDNIVAYSSLIHEVAHALKMSDETAWKQMRDVVTNWAKGIKASNGTTLYDAAVSAVTEEYKSEEEDAELFNDELVSVIAEQLAGSEDEAIAQAMSESTIFDAILNGENLSAKDKKNIFTAFKNALDKLINAFRDIGMTKAEREMRDNFIKTRDAVTEKMKLINEGENLTEKAAKNPRNKAALEALSKDADARIETEGILAKFREEDEAAAKAKAAEDELLRQTLLDLGIDPREGKDLTEEEFQELMKELEADEDKKRNERLTPLGNPYLEDGVSPDVVIKGTAVEAEAQAPIRSSTRARDSIAQRTLEAFRDHGVDCKKRKGWSVNPAVTKASLDAVFAGINDLAHTIETVYAGMKDKNGMPLLPEETKLTNNIFSNSSYLKDAEPTTECYRQTIYFALNKMVTDRLGRPLTQKEAIIVNQAAIEIGREAPCIYCYSLLDRKAKEAFKLQYLAERENFIAELDKKYHGNLKEFRENREADFEDLFQRYLSREFDTYGVEEGNAKKKSKRTPKNDTNQRNRLNLWLDLYDAYGSKAEYYLREEDVRNPDAEVATSDALSVKYKGEELKLKQRELADIQKWIQAASQAKIVQTYSAYTNDGRNSILNWSQKVIDKLNNEYGLRWYSHADYHPAFLIDNIQQITDASLRGLKGLMYCKPIEAAKIFAPTGMNINVSCFAKYVDGKFVCDDALGANWSEVQKLREKYGNVGAVMVCTSDEMVMWALSQDWVDVVIPLHLVRSGSEFVNAFGLTDFSAEQADKMNDRQLYDAFVQAYCKEHDITTEKGEAAVRKEKKSIYPKEHQNDYNTYMKMIRERGLTPRFDRIRRMVLDGEASYDGVEITPEMYMKLVNETRQSESQTKPLTPTFDMDAAKESLAQLPEKGYFDYFKSKAVIDGQEMTVDQVADRAAADIEAGKDPAKLGYGVTLENGAIATKEQAKEAGLRGIHSQKRSLGIGFEQDADDKFKAPITKGDLRELRSIGPKSVSKFLPSDIKKAQKWAYKYYKQMGAKSPFYRAWFGEWRAADKKPVRIATIADLDLSEGIKKVGKGLKGTFENADTRQGNNAGWLIRVSNEGIGNTDRHAGDMKLSTKGLSGIKELIENAVLLDSIVHEHHANNAISDEADRIAFDHRMYALGKDVDGAIALYRLTTEDIFQGGNLQNDMRFHNLKYIEKVADISPRLTDIQKNSRAESGSLEDSTTKYMVADVYRFVKQYDKEFNDNPRTVDENLLNKDGTPKVLYHQTAKEFWEFNTDNPVAGRYDSETPNGIFFKDNNHDIGIGGNRQMAVYLSMQNPLHFKNREEANRWYQKNIDGYAELQDEMNAKLKPIDDELQRIENEMFADDVSSEQYSELDAEWDGILEKMREVENDYRGRLRGLLTDYFIKNDSDYDGIILDYDGHRYVDGKRENVKTYIAFKNTQVKSATDNIGTFNGSRTNILEQKRGLEVRMGVPVVDTKAVSKAISEGEGLVEDRFSVAYEKTDKGFKVTVTDMDADETYTRTEAVKDEENVKAEAERAATELIRRAKHYEREDEIRREVKEHYQERIKKMTTDQLRRETKATAMNWNKKLVKMLANPTENRHVPLQLAKSVAEFTQMLTDYIDGHTKRGQKMMDKIAKAYDRAFSDEATVERARGEDASYDPRGQVLDKTNMDEQLVEMIKTLSEITEEKAFADLDRDEMQLLLNTVRGVAHTVTNANKLIGEAEGKTVWQTGSTMIEQLENAPKVSTKLRGYLATSLDLRRLARIFSGSNEDAEFVKLVEQLNQGAIEKERVAQELQAIFKPVTDEYGNEIKKWYGKKAEWLDTGIVTKDGVPVKITKGMRVSLALHVLNEGNMRHIERGGLTIPEAKLYAQGKLADAYANGKLVRLTAEQINDIIANMTEAEKAYVEAAKQLFHDRAGFYVNKTSLQLAGYTKANVENYFPIHTDKNFNRTDFASMSMDGSIEGQGFLKERVAASNPVYLEDITSVVNRQIRGVALYAGMAIPVRNFNAVMNAAAYEDENGNWVPRTTVKQTLAKTMGEYGAKVVEGFVEDASEMSQRVDVTPVERIAGNLATNYVKAVLLGNLKVAMKQVASYPTAAAVIPWKYLGKALFAGGKNHRMISRADVDLINKYTPLYQMRREGNANEVASLMNKPGMEQKLPWLLGWITKMDVMTVGRLWSAAEYMVEDTHKDLTKGSDEFYREVAKVFNQTIQQTQPNFTPLQRNAALRSKNPIVRSLTLFGTQRMQNGGILIEAAYELKHSKGKSKEEIAVARRKLGRAVASQVVQNFLLLAATFAVDALRGRMKQWQDDDDELTPESIASKMGDTFLSNFLGSFLGGTEFYETVSNMYKKANGQTTYDTEFSVPALDAIETIMSFGQSGIPNFVNYITGDHTDEEKLNKLKSFSMEMAKVAGYATGLPLENAVKDVFKGFIPAYKDIRDWKKTGELIPYLWQSGKLDSKKTRERYEAWIDSGHKGSAFFTIDKLLKGVGKRDDRAEILREQANLTPEDMALLMEMYDTSNGYAEGTGFYDKNGKLKYDFGETPAEDTAPAPADAQPEPAADDSSSTEDATASAAVPAPTAAPAAQPTAEATAQPKSDKYTKAAEKWAQYGVTQTQAKSAVEKWDTLKGSYEGSRAVSEYRTWLTKQNLTGRQRFAMFSQANADLEKKATEFNKKYGTKYEALWNAYTKYNGESFHGEEYRSWVEKQTSDYYQRFALVEFAEPRSNWIEHAEELHKAGVSYEAVWKAARYAKNQSGRGKKDRIIAYAKKLGMTSKQAENIYKWFG